MIAHHVVKILQATFSALVYSSTFPSEPVESKQEQNSDAEVNLFNGRFQSAAHMIHLNFHTVHLENINF